MTIETLLGSIVGLLAIGLVIGLIVGVVIPRPIFGCLALLAVPVAMFAYVDWWQGRHPEALRSTSGLDFLFGPLWPSLGAFVGYCAGLMLRSSIRRRD